MSAAMTFSKISGHSSRAQPCSVMSGWTPLAISWAAALASGPVAAFSLEQIGTGQMSESHRLSISYEDPRRAGPATAVLKLASSDSTSRATGVGLGIYAREVRFYTELAPRIGGPLASCSFAQYDPGEGWFTLLLEDVRDAAPGDQIAGCSLEQASLAMSELARLHAPVFADQALAEREWLNQPSPLSQALVAQLLPGFFERYGERVSEEHRALCARLVGCLDHWLADRQPPLGLVHGDFRLDNLLFGARPARDRSRSSTGRLWATGRRWPTPRTSSAVACARMTV